MRTTQEILHRIQSTNDVFGFATEVLIEALSFEDAKPLLKDTANGEGWSYWKNDNEIRTAAIDYLSFAWGKALNHRGISASRSVEKMTEFCWLLGLDQTVQEIEDATYTNYGCPKLKIAALALGQELPEDQKLQRMMSGNRCGSDYECGGGCD